MSVFASNEVNSVFTLFRYFLFYQRSKKYYFTTHRCKERDVDTVDWTPAHVLGNCCFLLGLEPIHNFQFTFSQIRINFTRIVRAFIF